MPGYLGQIVSFCLFTIRPQFPFEKKGADDSYLLTISISFLSRAFKSKPLRDRVSESILKRFFSISVSILLIYYLLDVLF